MTTGRWTTRGRSLDSSNHLNNQQPPPLEPINFSLSSSRSYTSSLSSPSSTSSTHVASSSCKSYLTCFEDVYSYLGHPIPIINGGQVKGGVMALLVGKLGTRLITDDEKKFNNDTRQDDNTNKTN